MKNILAIWQREMKSYFVSPIAYVVLTVFLFIAGYFFYIILTSLVQQTMMQAAYGQGARHVGRLGHHRGDRITCECADPRPANKDAAYIASVAAFAQQGIPPRQVETEETRNRPRRSLSYGSIRKARRRASRDGRRGRDVVAHE